MTANLHVTLVVFIVLQQMESSILLPYTMDKQADISPLLALGAVFAGANTGASIAIPLAGAVKVL